jgi:hypothetical protein
MKIMKWPILGLSIVLVATSCNKEDFKEEAAADLTTSSARLNQADTIGWKSSAKWETADQQTFSVRYFTIEDPAITTDVADNGLVLLFKRSGSAINALPFEEGQASENTADDAENNTSNYWYHQVAEGSLLISCDVYSKATTPDNANSFKYFVITPEKLQSLETDGYTTEKLMNLDYTEAAALLGGAQ